MNKLALVSMTGLALAAAVFAQESEHRKRSVNQQERISQGVASGQMTARETTRAEGKEAAINHEVRADRRANGGTLTTGEKAAVNRQQNRLSNQIYTDKHDASTAHYGPGAVGTRRENQQDRIAAGVASGRMNAGEAAKAENRASAINGEVRADRAANGGTLTPAEKARVNRQQNRASKQIYNEKHNQ